MSLTLYTIAVIGNGFAWSIGSLLAFRAIQGVGLAMFPSHSRSFAMSSRARRSPTATGIISAMFAVGATIGFIGSGYITQTYSWQTNYHLLAPVAAIVTLLVLWKIRESPVRTPSRLDIWGISLLGIAIVGFLVPLTEASEWGWASLYTLSLFAIAIIAVIALVYAELRGTRPPHRP